MTHVVDDARDFTENYWFTHQEVIRLAQHHRSMRASTSLSAACTGYVPCWKHKLPPAKVLELGSAHGGFVALLQWAGFEAMGLEVSPWVTDVLVRLLMSMLQGPIEDQHIAPGTLDSIALMDVVEHSP